MARRGRPKKLTTLDGVDLPPVPETLPPKVRKALSRLDTPMTPKEVAGWLKVSPMTVKRRMQEGMPAVNVGDATNPKKKIYRFFPRDVIAYLKKNGNGSGTPPTGTGT